MTRTKLISILENLGLQELPPHGDIDLTAYGLDSLSTIYLISEIENHFSVKISADDYRPELFQSLEGLIDYIERKRP